MNKILCYHCFAITLQYYIATGRSRAFTGKCNRTGRSRVEGRSRVTAIWQKKFSEISSPNFRKFPSFLCRSSPRAKPPRFPPLFLSKIPRWKLFFFLEIFGIEKLPKFAPVFFVKLRHSGLRLFVERIFYPFALFWVRIFYAVWTQLVGTLINLFHLFHL